MQESSSTGAASSVECPSYLLEFPVFLEVEKSASHRQISSVRIQQTAYLAKTAGYQVKNVHTVARSDWVTLKYI